ncbi:MAG: DUF3021 family protein [Defluviitaleaceae bacterium]|nr:DUF3021 family protein [Defluviitaleaceae bacterium]
MDIREIAARKVKSITATFTGAVLIIYVYALIFGIRGILIHTITDIIIVTLLIELAHLILYSKKELNNAQMIVRLVIHMLTILIIAISVTIYRNWIDLRNPASIAVLVGLIITVYIAVLLSDIHKMKSVTDRMNQKLQERYKKGSGSNNDL